MSIVLISVLVGTIVLVTYSYMLGYRHAKEDYEDLVEYYLKKIINKDKK